MRLSLVPLLTLAAVLVLAKADALAQPAAPVIECQIGDTLRWVDPADACGPLLSVEVESAPAENGPFSNIATVPAGEEEYVLTNTQSQAGAFRVVATYDCTPAQSDPSEVIITAPLPEPRIRTVDYTTAGTVLTWDAPDDPRVTRYIVYRETDVGTTILDTVDVTTYTELLTQVEGTGAIYYLAPLDDCDGTSFNSSTYGSATAVVVRDACNQEITITRQLPAAWPHRFVSAFVSRVTQRGAVDTIFLDRADSVLVVQDLPPDSAYTLRVTYVDDEGGSTTTFPISLGAEEVVADDVIEVAELSYDGTQWILRWRWNERAQYTDISWRISGGGDFVSGVDADDAAVPIPRVELGLDAGFDWGDRDILVSATDACGVTRTSLPAKPALIFAEETGPLTVEVDWRLPAAGAGMLEDWDLRFFEGDGSRLLFSDQTAASFTHDVSEINVREVCYQLVVEVVLPAVFDRPEQRFEWRSAPGCALRSPRVFFPTGYVPDGFTIGYRPRTSLLEGLGYQFEIYDRWGKRLFQTDDPFETWDGRAGGRAVPPGVYLALVTLEEEGRPAIRRESTVTLIR